MHLVACGDHALNQIPLDGNPDKEKNGNRQTEAKDRVEPQQREGPKGHVHAQHHELAVGKVDDIEHTEDEGETDGCECEDPSE